VFNFDNTYARHPERFFQRLNPTPVSDPKLVKINGGLALELGLDPGLLSGVDGLGVLAGNQVPEGAEPIAMAYAGHQFGGFSPQLGDGRAIILGEVVDNTGVRRDIQLKGSGPTRFSRSGDGRAALGPVLREYIISEAMAALGIPTTRALAAVMTGEHVFRETILPGAVLTRVATGLVRVGTFEFFAARKDNDGIRLLADYVIDRHYRDARKAANPYRSLLDSVIAAQADLVSRWMLVGFIHGVMNTDNMSIAGETIDYGPCAFMDTFHPATVFSSIDHAGRYAYGNQPRIAHWNLARFAQCLLPVLAEDEDAAITLAQEAINAFPDVYHAVWLKGLRSKLGLFEEHDGDLQLADELLQLMANEQVDFTNTFRALCDLMEADNGVSLSGDRPSDGAAAWLSKWRQRLADENTTNADRIEAMKLANPAYIPRNHRVEEALNAATHGDFGPFETLLAVLANPFEARPEYAEYGKQPAPGEIVRETFCGT